LSRLEFVSIYLTGAEPSLQLYEHEAKVQDLIVTSDLFPELIDLILFADVLNCPDHLGQAHLLVNEILFVWLQARFTSLQCLLEVPNRKRHRLPELFHQLVQVEQTLRECLELAHERLDLCFGVLVCILLVISMLGMGWNVVQAVTYL
jgi:hypothetical protein